MHQCWIINYRIASKCLKETWPVYTYISPPYKQVELCEEYRRLNVVHISTPLSDSIFWWYKNDAIQIRNRFNLVCPSEHPTWTWPKVDNKSWSTVSTWTSEEWLSYNKITIIFQPSVLLACKLFTRGKRFFSSSLCPDWLYGPPSLPCSGY